MDLNALLSSLNEGAVVLRDFAIALCATVLGWWLLYSAAIRLLKWSDPRRQYGAPSVAARFIVGSLFVSGSDYLNMQVLTWTGETMPAGNAMSVIAETGGSVPKMILQTALVWIATLGVLAILRGTSLIVKAADGNGQSQQEDPAWTAAVFIVSGSIGVNLWRWAGPYI